MKAIWEVPVIASVLILGSLGLIQFAEAQEVPENTVNEPLVYDLTITLMDISDVDYANGGYSLSFWLIIESDEIDFTQTPPPEINYVNGKIDDIEHEYFPNEHSYTAKVHGTFYTNMDFHNFPIMKLSLPIIIEPVQRTTDQVKFIQRGLESHIDQGLTISGLIFQNTQEEASDHRYVDGSVFSRYVVTYNFETPFLTSFMVGLFPILIMGFLVVFLFGIDPRKHDIKIEMIIGVFIAAVFFHVIDIGETLPPLEYLTLEDKAMTVLYAMLAVIMVEITAQTKWNEDGDLDKAKKINRKFLIIFIIVAIATALVSLQL